MRVPTWALPVIVTFFTLSKAVSPTVTRVVAAPNPTWTCKSAVGVLPPLLLLPHPIIVM